MGYLFSVGNYQIKDNELIDDNWLEMEWKVKGIRINPARRMNWSFRVGTKLHDNNYIRDILYFSILRNRIDYSSTQKSIFRNTAVEYTLDFDTVTLDVVRHYFLVGKNFPFKDSKPTFQMQAGFISEKSRKYSGPFWKVIRPRNVTTFSSTDF